MNTLGHASARRLHLPLRLLGAALLAALWTSGLAQGSSGDIRFTLTGSDHDGEYVLSGVPLFLCGFGYVGQGSYALQYYADDPTAEPSIVQLNHAGSDGTLPLGVADLLVGFGDISVDGVTCFINTAAGLGTAEVSVVDDGDSATMTVEGTTDGGVEIVLESVCHGVGRVEGG